MTSYTHEGVTLLHGDCMRLLEQTPDKYYSLCVCDPPYGIGRSGKPKSTSRNGGHKGFQDKGWDNNPPSTKYFGELFRVASNQIVWGANYYPGMFPPSPGWILWDKGQRIDQADGELAFTSFDKPLRVFTLNRVALLIEGTIHPTQKPTALYRWLLQNYARPGDTILDTHLGSGSSAIAAWEMGYTFTGIEIDEDYYHAAVERFKRRIAQPYIPGIVTPKVEQVKLI